MNKQPYRISFLLTGLVILSSCQNKSSLTQELNNIDLVKGEIALCGGEKFGDVNFTLSCNQESKPDFNLAISLLHSFEYEEAEKAFVKVIEKDPACVMGYWGVAMSNFHPLWAPPTRAELEKGKKILDIAAALPKSKHEQSYFNAISTFYSDWENLDHKTRTKKFENSMEALYREYPDDPEAAIFYALALNASADPKDKTYRNQKKAGSILENIFPDQPNHPGIAHYIIHNYDYPELASMALTTARQYASIAPASAHAQHMPSHIFIRLGLWNESIQSNMNSTSSALCYSERTGKEGHWDEELHGMDYLVYAYLQQGDNVKAKEQLEYLKTFTKTFPENFKIAYAAAAIPARIVLENRDWESAKKLSLLLSEFPWKQYPWQKAILHFAKGLGAARSGDKALAQQELDTLQSFKNNLIELKEDNMSNQVDIQIKTLSAWIESGNGNNKKAIQLMTEAANQEESTEKHPVTPCEVLPATELLGDLFFAVGDYGQALNAYELDLKNHPNRFNGLYGAARASLKLKDTQKARTYFSALLKLTEGVISLRPEIKEAESFLAINN